MVVSHFDFSLACMSKFQNQRSTWNCGVLYWTAGQHIGSILEYAKDTSVFSSGPLFYSCCGHTMYDIDACDTSISWVILWEQSDDTCKLIDCSSISSNTSEFNYHKTQHKSNNLPVSLHQQSFGRIYVQIMNVSLTKANRQSDWKFEVPPKYKLCKPEFDFKENNSIVLRNRASNQYFIYW